MNDTYQEETVATSATEARITAESIAAAKAMVGSYLRPEGPFIQDLTADTIRNYCNGIGDLNPMFRDPEHARKSRHTTIIAHPTTPMAYGYIGRTRWGFPGVHGFFAGNDWEFFKTWRIGDRMNCLERVVGVEEKQSKLSGRLIIQYVEANFINQHDELMARVLGWCTRHERQAARSSKKHEAAAPYQYTAEDIEKIEAHELDEPNRIRGSKIRYWQDVREGEEMDPIARGPLTANDLKGINVGVGRGLTHGLVLSHAARHPGHYYRNPDMGGAIEYTGTGHQVATTAQKSGAPSAYDYGPGRVAWLTSLVTNWMGDGAFLKRVRGEMRRFNIVGDTTWCRGKVVRKYTQDNYALVDLEIWAENQRGEITSPGFATVMLPSKDLAHRPVIDAAAFELGLAQIR
jgi:acyl dehydratase